MGLKPIVGGIYQGTSGHIMQITKIEGPHLYTVYLEAGSATGCAWTFADWLWPGSGWARGKLLLSHPLAGRVCEDCKKFCKQTCQASKVW